MPRNSRSLLVGRNNAPLTTHQVRRVSNTCLGLEKNAPFRVDPAQTTRFRVYEEGGEEVAEIIFGADVMPGTGVIDPNSSLGMEAAVAHELTHYFRWRSMTELQDPKLENIDEALTSLEAILRYYIHLNENDRQQLIRDAIQRLQLFANA